MANQKKLVSALELVADLANQNALDPESDYSGEPDLGREAKRQDKALEIITRFIGEMKRGNVPLAADILTKIQ